MKSILALVVAIALVAWLSQIESDVHYWHSAMSLDIARRKAYLLVKDSSDPEDLRSKAQAAILETDKDILKEIARKPYWSTSTDDELKALDAAKSDLGKDH